MVYIEGAITGLDKGKYYGISIDENSVTTKCEKTGGHFITNKVT